MVKVRKTTPEEEAEFADRRESLQEEIEADLIPDGDPVELASHILSGKEVVISDQVRKFLEEEDVTEDELIAMLLKGGDRLS